jgi:peptidyl-tRNA hydrolase
LAGINNSLIKIELTHNAFKVKKDFYIRDLSCQNKKFKENTFKNASGKTVCSVKKGFQRRIANEKKASY